MSTTKTYWKGIEELDKDEQFVAASQKEFAQEIPVDEFLNDSKLSEEGTTRRDFLKFLRIPLKIFDFIRPDEVVIFIHVGQ